MTTLLAFKRTGLINHRYCNITMLYDPVSTALLLCIYSINSDCTELMG